MGSLFQRKLADPGDDVLSEVGAKVRAGEMAPQEAISMGVTMLIAGHETTATMISLGTLALFEHPDQLALLRYLSISSSTSRPPTGTPRRSRRASGWT
ncbi:hypothetical protein [Streptomyces sp. JV178]|uniref:hypothetical protein n=1 Tax=Streptomyces sp. JV178 TaxID=858632 RepID=UPI00211ED8B0|nr:hypothetical protein [Streptomyces sp. JV178]